MDTAHCCHCSIQSAQFINRAYMGAGTHPGSISEGSSRDLELRTTPSWRDLPHRDLDTFCCHFSLWFLLVYPGCAMLWTQSVEANPTECVSLVCVFPVCMASQQAQQLRHQLTEERTQLCKQHLHIKLAFMLPEDCFDGPNHDCLQLSREIWDFHAS